MTTPLVTAIVSSYNSERFIAGCLHDLVQQSIFDQIEVLVIDSGSQQGETRVCEPFVTRHPNIRFLRTEREPLYATWNRALAMARGKYLTNANADDRHRADAFEQLAGELERSPEIGLVYADQFISQAENETHAQCEQRGARVRRWPDFTSDDLMLRCITGSQPMWRRALHDRHGSFDTSYRIAADYELWMRFAQTEQFRHVAQTLGVLFESPNTLSGSDNRAQLDAEVLRIKSAYLPRSPWLNRPGLRQRVATVLFSIGYRYVEHDHDPAAARPFLRAAWQLDPFNLKLAKTFVLRGLLQWRRP